MTELLHKFSIENARYNSTILLCAGSLWLIVLACVVSSILSQQLSRRQRLFWLLLVIFVPLFGALAYLPFSIPRDELPQFFLMRSPSRPRRTGAPTRKPKDS